MSILQRLADGVFTIPSVLSPEECREYVALTEAAGFEAATITTARGAEVRSDIRNNSRVIVDDHTRATELWERIRTVLPVFREGRQAIGLNERFRFYRYDPGEEFAPHIDGAYRRENGETSLLTFMIYLNEGFEGGETTFEEIHVSPATGMALLFDHGLLHAGSPVRQGRKYVLRSDVMYGPVGQVRG